MQNAISTRRLLWLLAALAVGILLLEATRSPVEKPAAPLMREAAARAQTAFDAIRAERLRRGFAINIADDPNGSGLIGDEYTFITTTLGSLESKRSTTNPNLAAAIVDLFTRLGLAPGDRVAANLSGSFPAANIAVLCAMDAMGLDGVAIPSIGASTYGANNPAFTYPDMEAFLAAEGLVTRRSFAFSMGGETDTGKEFPESVREAIRARLAGLGFEPIEIADLAENVEDRVRRFEADGPVKCFINVGGNLTSFGNSVGMTAMPGGILTSLPDGEHGVGLVQHYLAQGVPVVHLLNVKGLMADFGLPFDPIPLPAVGQGGVYWREGYRPWLVALVCAMAALALIWAIAPRKKKGPPSP